MTDSAAQDHSGTPWLLLAATFAILFALRLLGVVSVYFFEEDEASIAVGIAALLCDAPGELYRYTVQVGYYRLVQGLVLAAGGYVDLIPVVMKGLSALAGAVLPVAGFFVFQREWPASYRWGTVAILAVNPILWRSSQYGNTAMLATAIGSVGLIVLTNRPSGRGRLWASVALAGAVLIRADSVLLLPAAAILNYYHDRRWRRAVLPTLLLVIGLAVAYGLFAVVDPRFDSAAGAVAQHMGIERPSLFWELLLWAMGPAAICLVLWGIGPLSLSRPADLVVLLAWALPVLTFYFRATTTSRYFLLAAVPLSMLAAVGALAVSAHLERWVKPSVAAGLVGGFLSLHLFVALGHVPANRPVEFLYGGTFPTDDGPMQTGAYLVRTFLSPGSLARNLPHPSFGRSTYPFWEGAAANRVIDALTRLPASETRTVVVLWGGLGHAFHFHAMAAGAEYLPDSQPNHLIWETARWLRLGTSRLLVMPAASDRDAGNQLLDVHPGDRVWALKPTYPDEFDLRSLPSGLRLEPTKTFDPMVRAFVVVDR